MYRPARIHSTTLPGIGGRAEESISGCGLWFAASSCPRLWGVSSDPNSGRDGRLWASAGLLEVTVGGEQVAANSVTNVTA